MTSGSGRIIEIFLPDVAAPAVREGRVANRSILAVTAPRLELDRLLRSIGSKGGIYFLVRDDEDGEVSVYVGRSEDLSYRLQQHASGSNVRDSEGAPVEFTRVLAITGDDWQTVAHRMWLEAKIIDAMNVSIAQVLNRKKETLPELNARQQVLVSEVLDDVRLIMPVLGYDFLERAPPKPATIAHDGDALMRETDTHDRAVHFVLEFAGIRANIDLIGDRFLARVGSGFASEQAPTLQPTYKNLRARLLETGKVDQALQPPELLEDVEFSSATAAAQTLSGQTLQASTQLKHRDTHETFASWLQTQTPPETSTDSRP